MTGYKNEITDVMKINEINHDKENATYIPIKSVRITLQENLPEKVTIKHTSYTVQEYIYSFTKCFTMFQLWSWNYEMQNQYEM